MGKKSLFTFDVVFSVITNLTSALVFEFFLYGTARLVMPLLSFGKVVVDDFYLEQSGFNWIGLKRRDNGRYLMNSDVSKLFAVIFWMLCLAAFVVISRRI
ncbi:MAG TPA: hypothetical protein VD840_12070 [Sinorhizobium sp.]|nr:hypothetical protein [Sinorhizobium sp.]